MIALTSRLVLIFVLALAGISKLADRQGFREALREFRVPPRFVPAAAILIPLAELVTAGDLLGGSSLRWGAIAAASLLVVFTAVMGINVAQGRRPECACFGGLYKATTGWRSLVRNLFLLALAGVVLADAWSGSDQTAWSALADRGGVEAVGVLAVAGILALFVARNDWVQARLYRWRWARGLTEATVEPARRRVGAVRARARLALGRPRKGLPVGSEARFFYLPTLGGEHLDLDTLTADGKRLLL